MARKKPKSGWRRYWPRFLLLLPLLGVVWVPFYNRIEPTLEGIPFFYWYQLVWVLVSAGIVIAVYVLETRVTGTAGKPGALETRGAPGDVL
jgi:hypothetical protein